MVIVVLALDAADVRHAEDFGCENLLLDEHTKMQSVAHRLEHPHTGEAWPSIATGLHPTEHGMTGHGEWDSQALTLLSRVAHTLNVSGNIRSRIGDAIKQNTGQDWSLQIVDEPTFLDGEYRAIHNWPGAYRNEALHYIWGLFEEVKEDRMSEETLIRETYTEAASKFGWVHEAITHDIEIAATHIHVIDVLGHIYSDDRESYRQVYEDVDERVGEVRDALGEDDELLILSDHGMETTWLDDDDPGTHSWRAIASTTVGSPPEHALDVKAWVEEHVQEIDPERTRADIPEDQLRELGYID
ncbi:Type I phosphodiesterase / nucleotide pyrophosphatase [Halorientalis persicus]|uniref:Type I phosphodiesterase / nucleotide pyrophosphatase n=1 Tax=Halorientalis persicus TaxID=1367881 RepID=A0A1H8R1K6_9EURY|nr:alkaline phosphatase family protein [Halorientalis persicus]SEO60365.1 Type I phosphodiesterase / nucleotide pyrophosphatase [Halorientalis persicus]